jgi:hypothetical protein
MTQRIQRHPFLAIFDGADPSTSTPSRISSTTPLQALFLLNDPLVHEQAGRVARRLTAEASDDESRVSLAYLLLFSRPATTDELHDAGEFLAKARKLLADSGRSVDDAEAEAWKAYVRSLFRLNEFVYLD